MIATPFPPAFDAAATAARLSSALSAARPLPLHAPSFAGNEWRYVRDCLDTGWVSSVGSYVDRFERMLAERLDVPHVVATSSGTAALHLALLLAGVRPNDEVVVPALTFIATANAVHYCGAIPHLADCAVDTLGLDPGRLDDYLRDVAVVGSDGCINRRTGRRIRAVVPMHVFGHPVDMDALNETAARRGLVVVEDAAEALGSLYRGRPVGGLCGLGAISFNGNKIITCGGGGAVAVRDPAVAVLARNLSTTAKQPHAWRYRHDAIGFNYRLPNLNAALGCAQLERLDDFIAGKRRLAQRYAAVLADVPGIEAVCEPAGARSIYWLNAALVPDAAARDALLAATHAVGLLTRPAWDPLHRQPPYADCPQDRLSTTDMLFERLVCFPSGADAERETE